MLDCGVRRYAEPNSLHEWREPRDQREGIAAVSIGDTIDRVDCGLLVEPKVDPTDKPAELNENPGILEPYKAHDC